MICLHIFTLRQNYTKTFVASY